MLARFAAQTKNPCRRPRRLNAYMINRLTSRATGIQADVEAVGRKAIRQIVTDLSRHTSACSSPLSAKKSATCRSGTTNVCPPLSGNASGIATAVPARWPVFGERTSSQNGHLVGSTAATRESSRSSSSSAISRPILPPRGGLRSSRAPASLTNADRALASGLRQLEGSTRSADSSA
jgi:hypothetical protein